MYDFLLILLVPLLAGLLLHSVRLSRAYLNRVFVGAAFLQLLMVLWVFLSTSHWYVKPAPVWQFSQWMQLSFQFEPVGAVFVLLVSVLWCLTAVYCVGYMNLEKIRSIRLFYSYFLLSVFATLWIGFSGDLLTLFIGYEFLTFLTYPLVVSKGSAKAKQAGKFYLLMLLASSLLFLLAILAVQANYGTLVFTQGGVFGLDKGVLPIVLMGCFLWGVGKAALIPMHVWLPKAMVAPTPVSAFLHAVAVVKSGIFCLIKIGVYVFGFDFMEGQKIGDAWVWLPAVTLLVTGFWAMLQDDIKKRLAFSTVSQLSYITLGWLLLDQMGLIGSVVQMVAHAFAKITLFFVAGMIYVRYGVTSLKGLKGMGYQMPVTMLLFSIGSLSMVGLPFTVGFWGKFLLLLGILNTGNWLLLWVLIVGAVFSMLYLFQVVYVAFCSSDSQAVYTLDKMPMWCLLPTCVSGLGCVALFLVGPYLMDFLHHQLPFM